MRFLPFGKPETRAIGGLTEAVLANLVATATGTTTAPVATLAAVEACAGLWGRSFASAVVSPVTAATAPLTPAVLERIGRGLLLRGEAVFAIDVEGGVLTLTEAVTWDVSGRDAWFYRADFANPSGTTSRTLPADRILHPRIGAAPGAPWRGQSPLPSATAALAATIEAKLVEEVGGPVGSLIPVPHTEGLAGLQSDIAQLRGKVVLLETVMGGYGDKDGAPRSDWQARRIGAAPPNSLIELRERASAGIMAAAGVPVSLLSRADGTLAREELRRFAQYDDRARGEGGGGRAGGQARRARAGLRLLGPVRIGPERPRAGLRRNGEGRDGPEQGGGAGGPRGWTAMTTPRDYAPVLDRVIVRTIPGESPGLNPFGQPLPPGDSTFVKVWAARRDYRGRDFLQVSAGSGGLIGITSSRFIVRSEGPAWDEGDTFTDDKGATQTVQSVGEVGGRGRWLELLTQSTG